MTRRRRPSGELVYGVHAVEALLSRDPAGVLEVLIASGATGPAIGRIARQARALGLEPQAVPRPTLDRLCGAAVHQGIALRYRGGATRSGPDLPELAAAVGEGHLLLALDGVQDPHNLGACLRTAEAAGARAVLVPRHRSAGLTPAVRKVASGAAERLAVVEAANLARALAELAQAGYRIIGATADGGRSLYDCDLVGPLVLVLGAEGSGLRALTRRHCDELVAIPMRGGSGSLNVSVAAGVCLFEAVRQRDSGGGSPLAP